MQFDKDIAVKPVSEQRGRWLIDSQTVVDVSLTHAFLSIDLKVLDPTSLLRLYLLAVVISVREPIETGFAFFWHLV